jgi:hypothetical protein
MRLKKCLVSVALVAGFVAYYRLAAPPAPVGFETARELRSFVDASGLQTRDDGAAKNRIFFITDHAVSSDDMEAVATLRDCGLTPSWRGILWVTQIRAATTTVYPTQGFGGKWRVWGNVIVAGDEQLMDLIEELYRNQ